MDSLGQVIGQFCQWEAKFFLRTFNFMMIPLNRQTVPVTSIQLKVAVDFA